ncbi:MAG: 3'-5' exonuclease [Polyangiaceae bacterium]
MTRANLPPPPEGPPWDLPVDQAPLVFVDLEMTGLDVALDRVVEVCIERYVGAECTASFCSLVRPTDRVDGAAHVHGIDAAALAAAPEFAEIAPQVEAILEGAIFVAHAAEWDVRFLTMELKRAQKTLEIPHYIDTLVLARRAFAFRTYSLDALCKHLEIDRGQAHRAAADVLAMRRLFDRAVAILSPKSARDLWEVRVADKVARHVIVAACEEAVKSAEPVLVTYRPSRRAPESWLMVITEVSADLDPPHVIGYQLPGRGRRELRADRILRVDPPPEEASAAIERVEAVKDPNQ